MSDFKMGSLDHVHIYVPDRKAAAAWYAENMGFNIVPEFEVWSKDPKGPLTTTPLVFKSSKKPSTFPLSATT